jgi:hypothetical protein
VRWSSHATTYIKAYLRTRHVWDTFSHAETDSWGSTETTSSTLAWSTSGGSAGDYDIASGVGTTSLGSVNTARYVTAGSGIGDVEITGSVTIPVVAATADIHAIFLARFVDTSNWYGLLLDCDTGGQVDVKLCKMIAGSFTTLATASNELTYVADTTVSVRFQCYQLNIGAGLKAKAWLSTDDEPDDWTLEDVTPLDNELLLGGVGVRGLLATGNTNSLPVVLSWGDFTAFSAPQWTDVTRYVSIAQGLGGDVDGSVGRQTELADIDPSRLSLVMKNQSGWFTPDNVLSPYWPDWKTGTPVRWSETVGARSFAFPDMWLEIPEVTLSFERSESPALSDRMLSLNAVDLLTRLNRAPRFVSNLAAYIVAEATEGALRAYYPLTDASGSTYASAAGPVSQDALRFTNVDSYTPVGFIDELVNFGGQNGVPGDDGTAVTFTPIGNGIWGRLANSALVDTTPAATDFATMSVWVFVPEDVTTLDQLALVRDLDTFDIAILLDPAGGTKWMATIGTATGSDTALTGPGISQGWHLLSGQVDFGTGDISFWVDGSEVTGNTGGSGTGGKPLDRLVIDGSEDSPSGVRMAHLQLYIGDADAFTREDHLAQYEVGKSGVWLNQRVDERIRLICNLAGLADGQLDLEESDSLIQAPAFAGQRPGALASAASVTGGGILFTRGSELVYHDRKHRFNL